MITKVLFCEYMKMMKENKRKFEEKYNQLYEALGVSPECFDFFHKQESLCCYLLSELMEDTTRDSLNQTNIEYFVYELNYGESETAKSAVQYKDGTVVSLETPEQLYDFIVSIKNEGDPD